MRHAHLIVHAVIILDDALIVYKDLLHLMAIAYLVLQTVLHLVLFHTVLNVIHPVSVRPVNMDIGLIMVNAEIAEILFLIVLHVLHHVVLDVKMDISLVTANAHHAVPCVVRDPTFPLLAQQPPMPCAACALV